MIRWERSGVCFFYRLFSDTLSIYFWCQRRSGLEGLYLLRGLTFFVVVFLEFLLLVEMVRRSLGKVIC